MPFKEDEKNALNYNMDKLVNDAIKEVGGVATYKSFVKNNPFLGLHAGKEFTREYFVKNYDLLMNGLRESVKKELLEKGTNVVFNKSLVTQKETRKK